MIRFVVQQVDARSHGNNHRRGSVVISTKTGKRVAIADWTHDAASQLRAVGIGWDELLVIDSQITSKQFKHWLKDQQAVFTSPIDASWVRSMERKNGKAGN